MLPSGHFAGGFLFSWAVLKIAAPSLSETDLHQLLAWGAFFGFVPDLDHFWAFYKVKAFHHKREIINHRDFWSHTPLPWLIAGLSIYFFSDSLYWQWFGIIVWVGSWSHFILDSFEYGIMWLWPLTRKHYSVWDREIVTNIEEEKFFTYWIKFLLWYWKRRSAKFEIGVISLALFLIFL